jgi:hypothetical protein
MAKLLSKSKQNVSAAYFFFRSNVLVSRTTLSLLINGHVPGQSQGDLIDCHSQRSLCLTPVT